MKISKKIFGVALALIMIFNVFAVGTFAAFPEDTAVQLNISTDKEVYAPGDEVILTFNVKVIEELAEVLQGGQYEIAYNSAVLEPYSTSTVLTDHGYTEKIGGTSGYSLVQFDSACEGNGSWLDEGIASAYGVDTRINYTIVDDPANTCSANALNGVDVFSVKMKIKADAPDGTYTISYNPGGYEGYNAYVNDNIGLGGLYGQVGEDLGLSTPYTYEFGTCTFKVSSAPAVEVTHDGTQARYAYPGTPSAAAYQFGCLGKVTGLTVETDDANNVTNIQSIVATANYNGATVSSEVATMWVDGDAYGFRAVFKGFDYQDTKDITVTFAITMSDGTTVYTTADAATYTANGIYTAAVGRGMPEIA
jgi:hypothetical protein